AAESTGHDRATAAEKIAAEERVGAARPGEDAAGGDLALQIDRRLAGKYERAERRGKDTLERRRNACLSKATDGGRELLLQAGGLAGERESAWRRDKLGLKRGRLTCGQKRSEGRTEPRLESRRLAGQGEGAESIDLLKLEGGRFAREREGPASSGQNQRVGGGLLCERAPRK